MQDVFFGVGPAVIAIIAIASYKLARATNKRDPVGLAALALLLQRRVNVPEPALVAAAALVGLALRDG